MAKTSPHRQSEHTHAAAPPQPSARKRGTTRVRPAPRGRSSAPDRGEATDAREPRGLPSSLETQPHPSAARSGRRELLEHVREHPESGPGLTAGDLDANWEIAYSSGDEAPGGDNPTPDQVQVDDIGRALGVEYQTEEELEGARKLEQRDRHRWELDPASAEDYPRRTRS